MSQPARYCRCGCGTPISDEPGVPGAKRRWATDNCRKRYWDVANGALCSECGKTWLSAPQLRAAVRNGTAGRCGACHVAHGHWVRARRIEITAGMYNAGWSLREIAQVLYGPQSDSKPGVELREARQRGLIGYRYAAYEGREAVAA